MKIGEVVYVNLPDHRPRENQGKIIELMAEGMVKISWIANGKEEVVPVFFIEEIPRHRARKTLCNDGKDSPRKKKLKSSRSFVGQKVRKYFEGHGWFDGVIEESCGEIHRVVYEDGDTDDNDTTEVLVLVRSYESHYAEMKEKPAALASSETAAAVEERICESSADDGCFANSATGQTCSGPADKPRAITFERSNSTKNADYANDQTTGLGYDKNNSKSFPVPSVLAVGNKNASKLSKTMGYPSGDATEMAGNLSIDKTPNGTSDQPPAGCLTSVANLSIAKNPQSNVTAYASANDPRIETKMTGNLSIDKTPNSTSDQPPAGCSTSVADLSIAKNPQGNVTAYASLFSKTSSNKTEVIADFSATSSNTPTSSLTAGPPMSIASHRFPSSEDLFRKNLNQKNNKNVDSDDDFSSECNPDDASLTSVPDPGDDGSYRCDDSEIDDQEEEILVIDASGNKKTHIGNHLANYSSPKAKASKEAKGKNTPTSFGLPSVTPSIQHASKKQIYHDNDSDFTQRKTLDSLLAQNASDEDEYDDDDSQNKKPTSIEPPKANSTKSKPPKAAHGFTIAPVVTPHLKEHPLSRVLQLFESTLEFKKGDKQLQSCGKLLEGLSSVDLKSFKGCLARILYSVQMMRSEMPSRTLWDMCEENYGILSLSDSVSILNLHLGSHPTLGTFWCQVSSQLNTITQQLSGTLSSSRNPVVSATWNQPENATRILDCVFHNALTLVKSPPTLQHHGFSEQESSALVAAFASWAATNLHEQSISWSEVVAFKKQWLAKHGEDKCREHFAYLAEQNLLQANVALRTWQRTSSAHDVAPSATTGCRRSKATSKAPKTAKVIKVKTAANPSGRSCTFSPTESNAVIDGVRRFGMGKWALIQSHYDVLKDRTPGSIRDHFGILKKKNKQAVDKDDVFDLEPPANSGGRDFYYSPEESKAVVDGVRRFGPKKWAQIKKNYEVLTNRSPASIRDHFANLKAKNELSEEAGAMSDQTERTD